MSQQYPPDPNQPYNPQQAPIPGPPQYQPGPPPPGWQPPPPPKAKHTVRNVFIVLGILTVLGMGGCFAIVGTVGNQIDKQSNTVHTVEYRVGGTAKLALITYTTDGSASMQQENNARVPWSSKLPIKGLIRIYQVSAQNMSDAGTITCEIWEDGTRVNTQTSSGQGASADCTYTPQ